MPNESNNITGFKTPGDTAVATPVRTTGDISTGTTYGTTSATDSGERCETCGHTPNETAGFETLLAKIGINDQTMTKVREALSDIDLDEQIKNVRGYLTESGGKAKDYAKANPAKVLGGLAALVIGAGVLMQSVKEKR